MLTHIKYHLKSLFPVDAETPSNNTDNALSRRFITLSLKRSGQHAVINWICNQAQNIVHFNHCKFERRGIYYWITPINNRIIYYKGTIKSDSGIQNRKGMLDLLSGIDHYSGVLHSLEDIDIENNLLRKYINNRKPTVIIIMRDPYNWLASTMKRKDCNYDQLVSKIQILVKYLELALNIYNHIKIPAVFINYNKWVTSIDYRNDICLALDMPFSTLADQATLEIPDFGGGSSFDGTTPLSETHNSSVFLRWKAFADDPLYRELLDNRYLERLSKAFFDIDSPL